jgi:hypothetical protein
MEQTTLEWLYGVIAPCSTPEQLQTCLNMTETAFNNQLITLNESLGLIGAIKAIRLRIQILNDQHKSSLLSEMPKHLQDDPPVVESCGTNPVT